MYYDCMQTIISDERSYSVLLYLYIIVLYLLYIIFAIIFVYDSILFAEVFISFRA